MLETMERNRKAITTEIGTLSYYMNGAISFGDAYLLSTEQRSILSKVIEKHFEAMSGKSGKIIG